MQPATIRRLLVFGVCLVGVGCLYLVPSMAGSSKQVGASREGDLSTVASNTTVGLSTTADVSVSDLTGLPPEIPSGIAPGSSGPSTGSATTPRSDTGLDVGRRAIARAGATVAVPGRDQNPPDAVGRLTVLRSDPDRVTVTWPATKDDVGVVGYRVSLNGFFVLATQHTRATLAWFNDSNTHVIQVRALDAAGNEGPSGPTLLVTRPAPDPEPVRQGPSASTSTIEPAVSASPTPTQSRDQTTDANDAVPFPTTQESGTEEDGS